MTSYVDVGWESGIPTDALEVLNDAVERAIKSVASSSRDVQLVQQDENASLHVRYRRGGISHLDAKRTVYIGIRLDRRDAYDISWPDRSNSRQDLRGTTADMVQTVLRQFLFAHAPQGRVQRTGHVVAALEWRGEVERLVAHVEYLQAEKQELLGSVHDLRHRNEELYRRLLDAFKEIDALHGLGHAARAEITKDSGGKPQVAVQYVRLVESRSAKLIEILAPVILTFGLTTLGNLAAGVYDQAKPTVTVCEQATQGP